MTLTDEEINIIIGIIVFIFGMPLFLQLTECIFKCPCLGFSYICAFNCGRCCFKNPIRGTPYIV